ncbi:MAG: 3-hydroxyacyl-CoA dehydrogenase NAD-binding domain-containing protein [Rhizobiaceae bacterium]
MSDYVTVTRQGDVAVVTIDNPPVNALSFHMRKPLDAALQQLRDDDGAAAVVLTCAGRTFVAGADITEFGGPRQNPTLLDLIATLETFDKPVVAAIHGTALGGGLELALGCQYRIADPKSVLGLPEVKLGLLPGAGGTQRLPRLVGPDKALEMIVSGRFMPAREALADGLVDAIAADDLVGEAVAFARGKAAEGGPHRKVRDRDDKLAVTRANLAAFDEKVAAVAKKARGLDAPVKCAESVRNAVTMPFDEGCAAELAIFLELLVSEQSKAQRHLFFAQREAAKVEGVTRDDKPRAIARAGIIGAGTMGGGIAMSFVNGGIPVTLLEMSDEALKRGLTTIDKNYAISVSRGSISEDVKKKRLEMFTPTTSYDDLADCDIIIEAVFEEMDIKKQVFGKLDTIAKPGAVLASNTSYLDVNEIAASTSRPGDVLGMHFFSPANVMKLLEIVRGDKTAPDVIATALTVAKRIGKVPVVAGVCHGFIGNRMLGARSSEAESLLLEGATPAEVDKAFTDFGWPMGPFQMADLAGLDVGWRNRKSLGKTAAIADPLCEEGRYGQKTGKGYYLYEDGSRVPVSDPEVEKLIADKAAERGVNRRDISDEEILERSLYPMVNEGAKILQEGIAARASDIDIVWTNGYGFPIGKGGPMFWADGVGLGRIVERLEYWHGRTGNDVFEPAALLKDLAGKGAGFADLQAGKA